jgi:hypothetical protein
MPQVVCYAAGLVLAVATIEAAALLWHD